MGQRHQIYVKLPYEIVQIDKYNNNKEIKSNIVAIHHKWLFGTSPVRHLNQFMEFYQKANMYSPLKSSYDITRKVDQIIAELWSFLFDKGEYTGAHLEPSIIDNPLLADNDDGITIVDISELDKPKYAFLFLDKIHAPLNAIQYMEHYYHNGCYSYQNLTIEEIKEHQEEIAELAKKTDAYPVLTWQEIKEMFPAMYKNEMKRR